MLIAVAPIVALAIIATVALGATMLKEGISRASGAKGKPSPVEGELVEVDWLSDSWVVKVFKEHKQFSVDVLHNGEFIVHKTGFGSIGQAMAWGRKYVEDRS